MPLAENDHKNMLILSAVVKPIPGTLSMLLWVERLMVTIVEVVWPSRPSSHPHNFSSSSFDPFKTRETKSYSAYLRNSLGRRHRVCWMSENTESIFPTGKLTKGVKSILQFG